MEQNKTKIISGIFRFIAFMIITNSIGAGVLSQIKFPMKWYGEISYSILFASFCCIVAKLLCSTKEPTTNE
jgi:hypothetical protein